MSSLAGTDSVGACAIIYYSRVGMCSVGKRTVNSASMCQNAFTVGNKRVEIAEKMLIRKCIPTTGMKVDVGTGRIPIYSRQIWETLSSVALADPHI